GIRSAAARWILKRRRGRVLLEDALLELGADHVARDASELVAAARRAASAAEEDGAGAASPRVSVPVGARGDRERGCLRRIRGGGASGLAERERELAIDGVVLGGAENLPAPDDADLRVDPAQRVFPRAAPGDLGLELLGQRYRAQRRFGHDVVGVV